MHVGAVWAGVMGEFIYGSLFDLCKLPVAVTPAKSKEGLERKRVQV